MSHGWVRNRHLRAGVPDKLASTETADGTVRGRRLVTRTMVGVVEAAFNEADVTGVHAENVTRIAGDGIAIDFVGETTAIADLAVVANDAIKAYAGGLAGPMLTATRANTLMVTALTGGPFTNQPAGDAVEILSSSAADAGLVVDVYGTRVVSPTVLQRETVTLMGLAVVTTATLDWATIQGVEVQDGTRSGVGTVTFREASGNLTITTLAPAVRRSGVTAIAGTSRYAYNSFVYVTPIGLSAVSVGLIGTDADGVEQMSTVALGAAGNPVPEAFLGNWRTVDKACTGALDVASCTVRTNATPDDINMLVGFSRAAAAEGGAVALVINAAKAGLIPDGSIDVDKLGPSIATRVETIIPPAAIVTLAAVPVTIVPRPPPGRIAVFLGAHMAYNSAGVGYAVGAGDDFVIEYESGVDCTAAIETTGFLTSVAPVAYWVDPASTSKFVVEQQAIRLAGTAANPTNPGGSAIPLLIRAYYRLIDEM